MLYNEGVGVRYVSHNYLWALETPIKRPGSMRRELKIGILAIVTIIGSVWGYAFLKGRNLLTNSYTFYAKFDQVDQLPVSAPVLVSGYQIGSVRDINLDPDDLKTVVVTLDVENKFKLPKTTVVRLISTGLMGQKAIELKMSGPCVDGNCAQDGDVLRSYTVGMLESMLGESTIDDVWTGLSGSVGSAFDSINHRLSDDHNQGRISRIFKNIDEMTASVKLMTDNLNRTINSNQRNLSAITNNMAQVTSNLAANNAAIEGLLKNVEATTAQLAQADVKGLVDNTGTMMSNATEAMSSMSATMDSLQQTLSHLSAITADLEAGEGTMGKMLKDEALYNNLERMSHNLDLLLEDFRLNPKAYVHFSLLGKKQRNYEPPAFREGDKRE